MNLEIRMELDGWELFCAHLRVTHAVDAVLAERRRAVAEEARQRFADNAALAADPTVAALRRLFKAAGCDPSRYRPASEALLRRLIKGGELPAISPMVDVNNCLSARLAVPCCVMADGTWESTGPLVWRRGGPDDDYTSLRGPFKAEGKPLLASADGPLDTPITGNERVKVRPETPSSVLVAYLPAVEPPDAGAALAALEALADGTGVAVEGVDVTVL